jgi:hypothetical protein
MSEIQQIPHDERVICQFVKQIGESTDIYSVGTNGITKIVAYFEYGQMAAFPWVAIYKGDEISARMDCTNCVVIYKESEW